MSRLNHAPRRTASIAAGVLALGLSSAAAAPLPILHWTFDEPSGNALDTGSGAPVEGVFIGGATRSTNTPSGSGASLSTDDGNNRFVQSAVQPAKLNTIAQSNTSAFTISTWINIQGAIGTNTGGAGDRIVSMRDGDSSDWFDWTFNAGSASAFTMKFFVRDVLVTDVDVNSVTNVDANNKWAFLAVVFENLNSTQVKTTFYSGDLTSAPTVVGSTTTNLVNTSFAPVFGGMLEVGGVNATTTDRTPPALFDDLNLFGQALTAAELDEVRLSTIPEPASLALLTLGALAITRGPTPRPTKHP